MGVELPRRLEHRGLRHGTELATSKIETRPGKRTAVSFGDHPCIQSRVKHPHAIPELEVVVAVHQRARLFSADRPCGNIVVQPLDIIRRRRNSAELAPYHEGDQRARIAAHEDGLENQLLDPGHWYLRAAQRTYPLPQLRLVTLRDCSREPDQVPRLRIQVVLFRHHGTSDRSASRQRTSACRFNSAQYSA